MLSSRSAGGSSTSSPSIDTAYVVIELKVSRGYDRVVDQLRRYMGWVEQNMETSQPARGIIVANEITADLKLACSRVPDVWLIVARRA